MKKELYSLRQAADVLDVPMHVITYVLATKKAKEPMRVGNRRLFSMADLLSISDALKIDRQSWRQRRENEN